MQMPLILPSFCVKLAKRLTRRGTVQVEVATAREIDKPRRKAFCAFLTQGFHPYLCARVVFLENLKSVIRAVDAEDGTHASPHGPAAKSSRAAEQVYQRHLLHIYS